MQGFLLSFLIFLSCGFNSGYSETFSHKQFHFKTKFKNELSAAKEFRCENNEECQIFIVDSECSNDKFCVCPDSKVLSGDASKCLARATKFGSPCEENIQCSSWLSGGGICQDNKCVCKRGYHYLKGNCWKNIGLKEACKKDEYCFSSYEYIGFTCTNGKCECRNNYYERLNFGCRRRRKIGETCNLNNDCEEGTCEVQICSKKGLVEEKLDNFSNTTVEGIWRNVNCPKGQFELDGKCVLELGMNCKEDSECSHVYKAVCLDNSICACEPVFYVASEDNRKCLRVPLGKVEDIHRSSCQSDVQCGVFGTNTYCKDKRCACKNGTYFEVNEKLCWEVKSLQESCIDNKDCHSSVTHAECRETTTGRKCLCQKGFHQKGSECVPDALEVGHTCDEDEDCLFPHSTCKDDNTCDCKKHYYVENGKCKSGVGTTCINAEDCAHLKNTECKSVDLKCLCMEDHIHSNDYKYCLPVVRHKDKCEESFQCTFRLGDLGECKNNVCECRDGAHYADEMCHKSKFEGESCQKRQDCFTGNDTNSVICLKGICRCNYDYELDKSRVCVKANSATATKFYSMSLMSLVLILALR